MAAKKKQEYRRRSFPDKESEYGPPDRTDNFVAEERGKAMMLTLANPLK